MLLRRVVEGQGQGGCGGQGGWGWWWGVGLRGGGGGGVGCLVSRQHASVSQGKICFDSCTYCLFETEVADQTFYLTRSQYTDTRPTSPSTDPMTPGTWQCSHWSANF